MRKLHLTTLLLITSALAACSADKPDVSTENAQPDQPKMAAAKPELGTFGVALENMDKSVKPGDNFFKYVNGTWLKNTEIPADKSNYGGFSRLADRSELQVRAIIEDTAQTNNKPGSPEQKIGDLYAAFMDQDGIERAGLRPVAADLARIDALADHSAAAALLSDPGLGLGGPMGAWIDVDAKDTDSYIVFLTQSGLGMPNRSYYLDDDEKSQKLRAAYLTFLENMLGHAEDSTPKASAEQVMAFETEMASVHWEPAKRRNRDLTYNKKSLVELKAFAPGYDWSAALNASDLTSQKSFIVREADAIQNLAEIFGDTPLPVLKAYMKAHHLSNFASYLPKAVDSDNFEFYGKALRGTEQQRARWKRGVSAVSSALGEAIGQVYVKRHFAGESKRQMDELVENLRAAFKDGIDGLEWMGDSTKAEAQTKLRKFYPKIGYPKNWKDYSALTVDRIDLVGTRKSANAWEWNDQISKLGGPIDREEWFMYPQTVNAYYHPTLNEIVFPAAILQAPFFDAAADPAVNYCGIGAVIGHEMGHGFDDQGAKSDGNGVQRDWWTAADKKAFKERGDVLIAQYEKFEPLPGLNLDGKLTLGENIGDLTGLTMGYAAYKKFLGDKEAPIIDGLTGDQRCFLAYGQIWQRKFRDEELRNRIKSDPHSPGEFRANGIVRNFDAWYDAFNVKPGDALYLPPEKRVKIW